MPASDVCKYLGGEQHVLPCKVRVTPDGRVSIIDLITVICFTDDTGRMTKNASDKSSVYYNRLRREHVDVQTLCMDFKFPGRGQRDTPVAARKGVLQFIQLLRGKKAAKFRESIAALLERYIDADMGLADDITDRALDNHMADLEAKKAQQASSSTQEVHKRIESRDTTKELGQAIKGAGAPVRYYGLMNGGVNRAVTGMPTAQYRAVQVNLRPKEAAREAFTDSMLGMTGTINCLVRDNLADGSSADAQLQFMQDQCAKAAELLGLHKKARDVQTRKYITGNKRVMSQDLAAQKCARLAAVAPVGLITA